MKKLLLILGLTPLFVLAQDQINPCETIAKINTLIQEYHYKPKPIDDSLSVYIFKDFLDHLDPNHNLFIQSEIDLLKKQEYAIDNYIKEKNCTFLEEFYNAYTKAIDRYGELISEIKREPFLYSSSEKIQFSKKAYPFLADKIALKKIYKKSILFSVLRDIAEMSNNKDSLITHFDKIAPLSKAKILDQYDCKINSYKISKPDFYTLFYSAFCHYFDPHTEYFSQDEKSTFLSSVSADNLSFGLYVSISEKDETIVESVISGSSAYFAKKIETGDELLKIKSLGEEYILGCSTMKKVDEIISSSNYKTADFTFRKKSGEIYTVTLVKKVLKDYQNNVYSYTIEKEGKKIGYIKIPSFYATFENGKTNVSDDVIKEIYKLQKDNIVGLIIDLQNNGGGSMDEAVKLTGMFIDIGPIAIMNNKEGKTQIVKDPNRGAVYLDPMVVLINGFSASASEFFTNAMQDYNRAIVVGNTSLGKASMQRILPLGNNNQEFLKLTIEKFYRITGKSNQTIGIKPDVEIPSLFNEQMPRENSYPTALKNDEIARVLRYNPIDNPQKGQIIENSKNRLLANADSKNLLDINKEINLLFDNDLPPVLLQFNSVFENVNNVNQLWKKIKKITEKEYPITVERNSLDIEYQKFDEYLKSNNLEKIKEIRSNLHIVEAVNIINDFNK